MRVQIVAESSVRFSLRDRVQIQDREFVVVKLEREEFGDYPTYVRYDLELGRPEDYLYKSTPALDLMADKRIKSWHLSYPLVESFRIPDLSEFESAVRARAPEIVEHYHNAVHDAIRAEVEAMDWPELIDG